MLCPSDKAISSLGFGKLHSLYSNPNKLKQLLLNHILPNVFFTNNEQQLPASGILQTVGGASIPFEKTADGTMTVGKNKAKLIYTNFMGSNGAIHIIDRVIQFN